MKTILIFAGTTEGRKLVEILDRNNIVCHVCVATEYGNQVLHASDNVTVHTGRLDEAGMRKLMQEIACDIVIDATHPYAVLVTDLIQKSLKGSSITYLRLLREEELEFETSQVMCHDNMEACASYLKKATGKVLLTTGSKQLKEFTRLPELKERVVARVIPGEESLALCYAAGLKGSQIIAMQGPFSQEMNEIMLRDYEIAHLVTKQSGTIGGVEQKLMAAQRLGVMVHIIRRPKNETNEGYILPQLLPVLESMLQVTLEKGKVEITLAGIGPGDAQRMTGEVAEAIREADVLFGAKRMLAAVEGKGRKYPYYLKEDILPVLQQLAQQTYVDTKVVILFSGDTGFYSGCKKMKEALETNAAYEIRILPGISSIQVLSASCGIDWQDASILSLHGVSKEKWMGIFMDTVRHSAKTFFITSGVSDVQLLGTLLTKEHRKSYTIYLGYQLSYPEEQIVELSPVECSKLTKEGLYVGVVLNETPVYRSLVPTLEDDFFLREQVPMTKEDVRKLAICQMKIKEHDIVYDIGCGSGSVAVQIGALSPTVAVYGIECNLAAVDLSRQNVAKAQLSNVTITEAMAPEGLKDLPKANVAFIGGTKGNLEAILKCLYEINPIMRIVLTAVSMEAICGINQLLKEFCIENLVMKQVAISQAKKLGEYHLLYANNPVLIFAFDFKKSEAMAKENE